MKLVLFTFLVLMILILPGVVLAQQEEDGIEPMLSTSVEEEEKSPKVTVVYGVTADDYLPAKEVARRHLRPNVRKAATRPNFDLPDAFYFIGGPVFLLILLRVLVIFINGFEEKRKEEMRAAASQKSNPKQSGLPK
jgi:hypothetical protein